MQRKALTDSGTLNARGLLMTGENPVSAGGMISTELEWNGMCACMRTSVLVKMYCLCYNIN